MTNHLTKNNVAQLLAELDHNIPKEACWTCDCFQGFLTQLEIDAGEDVSALISPYKVDNSRMHGCLGCDPCPPGSLFANYLRAKQ